MAFEIKGVVVEVTATEFVGANNFPKRTLVVEASDNPQYSNLAVIDVLGDACDLFDNVAPGEQVAVMANFSGREWGGKYYCGLRFWKFAEAKVAPRPANPHVHSAIKSAPRPAPKPQPNYLVTAGAQQAPAQETYDDLPF